MTAPAFDIVVPTIGRPSLAALVEALSAAAGPLPGRLIVVDDRRDLAAQAFRYGGAMCEEVPLELGGSSAALASRITVMRSGGRGPAAARNIGWRASRAPWIAFLDDDVVPSHDWLAELAADIARATPDVGGVQGVIHVPMPGDRRPTDWERNVRELERAQWATADLAYRRSVLVGVGGFDERFPRAYREDADLGLRVTATGYRIVEGRRRVAHPVGAADRWISVRRQRGNADDALMRVLHGRGWRVGAGAPNGRRARHVAITTVALAAVAAALTGRRRLAAASAALGLAGIAELAWARIAPGPRSREEVVTMVATSAVIPFAATWHWARGWLRMVAPRRPAVPPHWRIPRAVLFDRDGTLVVDVPYNGDPTRVELARGAREAIERLRAAGVPFAVVSNQSGVARGLLTLADVEAVNRRVEELLGMRGAWFVCPHGPDDGCDCRKPAPGLVLRAAATLGVLPHECAVIGDTAADIGAAVAAGARGVLVPNPVTRREEIDAADETAPDLVSAVDRLLSEARR